MNEDIAGELLCGAKRTMLTGHVLMSGRPLRVSETARELGLSKSFVSTQFRLMERVGILKRTGNTYHLRNSPAADALRTLTAVFRLANLSFGESGAVGAGLYGSTAKGRNREGSDVDVWAFFESRPPESEVAGLAAMISDAMGSEADLLVIWPGKMEELRRNERLICALRESRTLFGRDFAELETMY